MQLIKQTPIFNPNGSDDVSKRQIWGGNSTGLFNLNNVKYSWATQLYNNMREFFWVPQKGDLTQDVVQYNELLPSERKAYKGILSYLTFLDSTQTVMLPHLSEAMTAPEVRHCLSTQQYFESIHNSSYQYIIETIIPSDERESVYTFWRDDNILFDRCSTVANLYQKYLDSRTKEDYFYCLFADFLLEGLYFWSGFNFFYTLASRHLMVGTSDQIKLIQRDEQQHIRLFQKILEEGLNYFPYSRDRTFEIVHEAVNQEILWTNHITDGGVLGITEVSTESYVKYIANLRLKSLGLGELYQGFDNDPYKHLQRIADTGTEASVKANFFESTVTSYVMSSGVSDWDF